MDLLVQPEPHTAAGSPARTAFVREGEAASSCLDEVRRRAAPAGAAHLAITAAHASGRGSAPPRRLLHLIGYTAFGLAVAGIVLSALILAEPRRPSPSGEPAGAASAFMVRR